MYASLFRIVPIPFCKMASLSYVEELLAAGVTFYEYEKGFIHAKVLIVDELLGSVGTANMDMRSFSVISS